MIFSFHFTGNIDISKKPKTRLEIKFILERKLKTYIRCWMVINGNNQFVSLENFSHKKFGKAHYENSKWNPGSSLKKSKERAVYHSILAKKEIQDIIKDQVWNIQNIVANSPGMVGAERKQLYPLTYPDVYRIYVHFGTSESIYRFQMDTIVDNNQYFLEEINMYPNDPQFQKDVNTIPKETFLYEVYKTEILIGIMYGTIRKKTRLRFINAQTI